MKKLTFLLALVFLLTALTPISVLAEGERCKVIFRTTEQYIRLDGDNTVVSYEMELGQKILFTPSIFSTLYGYECAYRLVSTGETVNPTDLTVNERMMYFDVYLLNPPDVVHSVTYTCNEYPGIEMFYGFGIEDNDNTEITVFCPDGYTLQEDDIPHIPYFCGGLPQNYYLEWTPDPVGYKVTEDVTFNAEVKNTGLYDVTFWDYSHHELGGYAKVPRGSSVEPPKDVPDWHDYMFIGWSSDDYLNVQCNLEIFAKYALRGDANMNDEIDVGDATLVLRAVVKLDEPGMNYDYNKNGRVDSGDAAGILIACVSK